MSRRDPRQLLPDIIRKRFAGKLGAALLAVMLVIASVGGYTYFAVQSELQADAEQQLETDAETAARLTSDWLAERQQFAELLASSDTVNQKSTTSISQFFISQKSELPEDAESVHYVDMETFVIETSTRTDAIDTDLEEEGVPWATPDLPYYSGYISKPFESPLTGERTIAFVAPVPQKPGQAIVLFVNLDRATETLPEPAVQDGEITLVNGDGATLMSQGSTDISGITDSAAVERGLDGKSGYLETNTDGAEHAVGYAPVVGVDWVVVVHSPTSSVFAVQQEVSQNLLLLLGLTLVGFLLIGLTIGRNTARDLTDLASRAEALESGDLDTTFESSRADEVGQLYAAFGSMRDALRERIEEAERRKEEAENRKEEAERRKEEMTARSRDLEAKAEEFSEAMDAAAAGDLTRRMHAAADHEVMNEIARSFNGMMDDLEQTVGRIAAFASTVAESSQDASGGAAEIETAAEEVSESIREISDGADRQDDALQDVSDEMTHLSGTIQEVASSATEVATASGEAVQYGEDGQDAATEALREMDRIEEAARSTKQEVTTLNEKVSEIGDIAELINQIAEQTNTLALNASVEAARAGDAGDGFGVVADEIKELSEQVGEAIDDIESLITDIQDSTEDAVTEMQTTTDRVEEGTDTVEDALQALEDIVEQVQEANQGVQEISKATDQQAESVQDIVTTVDEVADISDETSEKTSRVSAAAQQQAASVVQVGDNVQELARLAEELQTLLEQFEISESATVTGDGASPGSMPGTAAASPDGGRSDDLSAPANDRPDD